MIGDSTNHECGHTVVASDASDVSVKAFLRLARNQRLTFSTAERQPLIPGQAQKRLHAYIGCIARDNGMAALVVGGVADHIHVLLSLSRTVAVAKAVQLLKAGSSKWVKDAYPELKVFAWQEGCAAV